MLAVLAANTYTNGHAHTHTVGASFVAPFGHLPVAFFLFFAFYCCVLLLLWLFLHLLHNGNASKRRC